MTATRRQLGEATVKRLRQMCAAGESLHVMSKELGLRISEVEEMYATGGMPALLPGLSTPALGDGRR